MDDKVDTPTERMYDNVDTPTKRMDDNVDTPTERMDDKVDTPKKRRRKITVNTRRYSKRRLVWYMRKRSQAQKELNEAKVAPQNNDKVEQLNKSVAINVQDEVQMETNKEENEEVALEQEVSDEDNWITEKASIQPEEQCNTKGKSIVDLEYFFNEMKRIGDHSKTREDCGIRHLRIINVTRRALKTIIHVKCGMCQYVDEISSEPDRIDEMDVNLSAVAGTICTGGGYAQLEEFLAAMDMPCMPIAAFTKCHDKLRDALFAAAEKEMIAAAEEEKQLAIERGDVLPISGLPHVAVVADGSWMKRSYSTGSFNSLSGVGVIIGYHTKKVLFIGVRNKKCLLCLYAANRNQTPRAHVCFKNWDSNQGSSAMESDAILEGFVTSIEKRGLVYSKLIADGDSSSYKKILDANPYEIPVKKIECTNHLLRNFCRKMREIAKKAPRGPLRKVVEYSVLRMRVDILKASKFRNEESRTIPEKMKLLYADLLNIPKHTYGDHSECVNLAGFCGGNGRNNEKNMVSELTDKGVLQKIQEIMRPLLVHVESLLYNRNNNMVESFNSLITKYIGGKRLNFGFRGSYAARCALAVIQYNSKEALARLCVSMEKKPNQNLMNMVNRRKRCNESNTKRIKKNLKRGRNEFRSENDPNYGPNAEKPDMPQNIFEVEGYGNTVLSQDIIMGEIGVPVETTASMYERLSGQALYHAEDGEQNFVPIMQCNADSGTFEIPILPISAAPVEDVRWECK